MWEFRLSSGCKDLPGERADGGFRRGARVIACGSKEFEYPLSRFPLLGERPGREGSPHAAKSGRLPPQEGLPPPLCIPPVAGPPDAP